jgi:hypothetical protein
MPVELHLQFCMYWADKLGIPDYRDLTETELRTKVGSKSLASLHKAYREMHMRGRAPVDPRLPPVLSRKVELITSEEHARKLIREHTPGPGFWARLSPQVHAALMKDLARQLGLKNYLWLSSPHF